MGHIIVTGASGFIGSALVKELSDAGNVVSTVGSGCAREGKGRGLCADSIDAGTLKLACELHGEPVVIVHLAGSSSVGRSIAEPASEFNRTLEPTLVVLEHIRSFSPSSKIIYASSAAVYGQASPPQDISSDTKPVSPYGVAKYSCEQLIHTYARYYGVKHSVFRIFSVYGEGLKKQLLWDACNQLESRGRLELGGTGAESRDFVHVDDLVQVLTRACANVAFEGKVFNVCTGRPTTVSQIASMLLQYWPGASCSFSGQIREGDPVELYGVPNVSGGGLICEPFLSVEEGVDRYVSWFKSKL